MKVFNRAIKLGGQLRKINSVTVTVLAYDKNGKVLLASGTSVPTGAGYAKSGLFIKTDASSGTKGLYENQGTTASASFNLIGDISSAEIAADAIDATKIADDAVSLEHLDAGITPSHIVVAAGQFTTAGGDANESATATGVLATDIAIAVVEDNGTNNVTLLQTAAASNAVNFTMSADPGTDCLINWMVMRAAA